MADYYPILARAVANLPHNNAQARRDVYARARMIVAEQLRGRAPQSPTRDAMREQAALETAIRRIETEARSGLSQTLKKPAAAPAPRQRAAVADAQERADKTARSLSKILQAVQPDVTGDAEGQSSHRNAINGAPALVRGAEPRAPAGGATSDHRKSDPTTELGGAPSSLGMMLFATAYIVAAVAFTGVTYIRCLVWLYQGVIGYPILLAVMAVTLALFIVPPALIFRKTSALPAVDVLLRYIHSASRRVP